MMLMDLRGLVEEQLRANNEAVERMVERMLVLPGDHGVLVTTLPRGNVQVELSDQVPFGEIRWARP